MGLKYWVWRPGLLNIKGFPTQKFLIALVSSPIIDAVLGGSAPKTEPLSRLLRHFLGFYSGTRDLLGLEILGFAPGFRGLWGFAGMQWGGYLGFISRSEGHSRG